MDIIKIINEEIIGRDDDAQITYDDPTYNGGNEEDIVLPAEENLIKHMLYGDDYQFTKIMHGGGDNRVVAFYRNNQFSIYIFFNSQGYHGYITKEQYLPLKEKYASLNLQDPDTI